MKVVALSVDDEATTLERFVESAMHAYRVAMTPPMGPVALVVPEELQEALVDRDIRIPELTIPAPPQGETGAVREAARLLVNAERPMIQISKIGRTPKAWDLMIVGAKGKAQLLQDLSEFIA